MKKTSFLLVVLMTTGTLSNAQIPNSGFEEWTIQDGIEIPAAPWVTNNLQDKPTGVSYNPVTKSTDHYPENAGSYSLRMENNTSFISESGEILPFWACSYGFSTTAKYPGYNGPVFPVTGHPNNLNGYYKFIPQNNDTMLISISLFLNGEKVASAAFSSSATVTEWTSYSIPIPAYSNADSAQIGCSAFYSESGKLPGGPWGNSILYIDNFSFDALISGSSKNSSSFNIHPNPASNFAVLSIPGNQNSEIEVTIYTMAGGLIRSETLNENDRQINIADLGNNIYIIELRSKEWTSTNKLIVQRK